MASTNFLRKFETLCKTDLVGFMQEYCISTRNVNVLKGTVLRDSNILTKIDTSIAQHVFTFTEWEMARRSSHQRSIFKIQKIFIFARIFEFCLVTQFL
jgi:hypothetical protein